MQKGGDAVRGIVDEPVLDGGSTVAQQVGVAGLLHTELREVANTIGDQFAAFGSIQLSLVAEEVVHIHALQLGDALFLRHLAVEFIHLLLDIHSGVAACQQYCHTHK